MKISKNTRVARAGEQMAKAIVEMVHLLYLDGNALQFLQTLLEGLDSEFRRRKALAAIARNRNLFEEKP